jgi:hypothetical protein
MSRASRAWSKSQLGKSTSIKLTPKQYFVLGFKAAIEMINTPPQHNVKNPPGQIVNPITPNFEQPLASLIKEYASETHQKALQDAFDTGWHLGYREGVKTSSRPLFPQDCFTSEAAR